MRAEGRDRRRTRAGQSRRVGALKRELVDGEVEGRSTSSRENTRELCVQRGAGVRTGGSRGIIKCGRGSPGLWKVESQGLAAVRKEVGASGDARIFRVSVGVGRLRTAMAVVGMVMPSALPGRRVVWAVMTAVPFRLVRAKAQTARSERRECRGQRESFDEHLRHYNDEAAESIHQSSKINEGPLLRATLLKTGVRWP